ncbi:MAG: hypothetical protein SVN78_06090, partial [Deferribacterota bacterium]|nr:hypothetical protein [Deferribacterota bacterium]
KEFWRMYQSGEFIHYLALCEDWFEEASWQQNLHEKIKPPMSSLGIIGSVVFQMTEIFVFLSRLGTTGIYDDGVHVFIILHNTENRELWTDVKELRLLQSYKSKKQMIKYGEKFNKEQIMTNPKDLAFNAIKHIFDEFGWHNPPDETIKNYQDKLLNGRN